MLHGDDGTVWAMGAGKKETWMHTDEGFPLAGCCALGWLYKRLEIHLVGMINREPN
jgi:hypothetical protein